MKIGASKRKAVLLFSNSGETARLWIIWTQKNPIITWRNKSFRWFLWEPSRIPRRTRHGNSILSYLKEEKHPSHQEQHFYGQLLLLFKLSCPVPQDSCLSGKGNPACVASEQKWGLSPLYSCSVQAFCLQDSPQFSRSHTHSPTVSGSPFPRFFFCTFLSLTAQLQMKNVHPRSPSPNLSKQGGTPVSLYFLVLACRDC